MYLVESLDNYKVDCRSRGHPIISFPEIFMYRREVLSFYGLNQNASYMLVDKILYLRDVRKTKHGIFPSTKSFR